jgi:hypothetical protein
MMSAAYLADPVTFLESLNRQYGAAISLGCKYQAGQYSLAIEIYGAGTTFPGATAVFGTGQLELVPENINQPIPRIHRQFIPIAIDLYLNVEPFH